MILIRTLFIVFKSRGYVIEIQTTIFKTLNEDLISNLAYKKSKFKNTTQQLQDHQNSIHCRLKLSGECSKINSRVRQLLYMGAYESNLKPTYFNAYLHTIFNENSDAMLYRAPRSFLLQDFEVTSSFSQQEEYLYSNNISNFLIQALSKHLKLQEKKQLTVKEVIQITKACFFREHNFLGLRFFISDLHQRDPYVENNPFLKDLEIFPIPSVQHLDFDLFNGTLTIDFMSEPKTPPILISLKFNNIIMNEPISISFNKLNTKFLTLNVNKVTKKSATNSRKELKKLIISPSLLSRFKTLPKPIALHLKKNNA